MIGTITAQNGLFDPVLGILVLILTLVIFWLLLPRR